MIPGVHISDLDGQTGVSPQADPEGIIAIIAGSNGSALPLNTPQLYVDWATARTDAGDGPLTEYAAYMINTAQKPVLLVRSATSQAGVYGAFDNSGMTGSSVPSAGGTEPLDSFDVVIVFGAAGTIGVAGITYQVSLQGGDPGTFGPKTALGTANSIVIPNTGITIALAAGTVAVGDTCEVVTTGPRVTNADLAAALEGLRTTSLPYESLIIDAAADGTMIAAVDTWLAGIAAVGEYKVAALNARYRNIAASETEAAYAASLAALRSTTSKYIVLAADAGDTISPMRNIFMRRPAALDIAARTMKISDETMASLIGDGPLDNVRITDAAGNPKYHDEQKHPGLDDLKFATLRTVPRRTGAFNTLPRLFSPDGSDWVFWPQARVLNLAKSIAYDVLTAQCSIGVHVRKNPQNPQVKNITEPDAQKLEELVQEQFDAQIVPKKASSMTFELSRSDDLSSNDGHTLTGTIDDGALRYVVAFNVNAKFV